MDQINNNQFFHLKLGIPCYKWEWHITWDDTNDTNNNNNQIYHGATHQLVYRSIVHYIKELGKYIYDSRCTPMNYYAGYNIIPTPGVPFDQITNEIITKKDSSGNIYEKILSFLKLGDNTMLAYSFENPISVFYYICLIKFNIVSEQSKIIIFSKNHFALDAVIYYKKYVTYDYQSSNIKLYLYLDQVDEKTFNFLAKNDILHSIFDNNTNNNNSNNNSNTNIDLAIIDIIINPITLSTIDDHSTKSFHTYFPALIMSIEKLNMGGTILLNTSLIMSKWILDFVIYLSCHFAQTFIYEPVDKQMQIVNVVPFSVIIFKNYNKPIDTVKLREINQNKQSTQNNHLSSIVSITQDPTEIYNEYKLYTKAKLLTLLEKYTDIYQTYINHDDKNLMAEKCFRAKLQAIILAKKYDLPLVDWIDDTPEKYFQRMFIDKIRNIGFTKKNTLPPTQIVELKQYDYIRCHACHSIKRGYELSELTYQYMEKINIDQYKKIELDINREQKKLNFLLFSRFDVNINKKMVSRAWLKMYELLYDTAFLDNIIDSSVKTSANTDSVNIFHICEAPGNFINATDYFIKHNTKIKNYNWMAQSLAESKANFFDSYGFIKKTINQWDLGPSDNGDITDIANLEYYYKKYGHTDAIISDCGEKWKPSFDPKHDITIFQMIYALLFPRIGGNFIIKTFSTNYNIYYLMLLYIASGIYQRVLVFKSNINFWSPEIYIIGINKQTNIDYDLIIKFAKSFYDKPFYLVNEIPDTFIQSYQSIIMDYITEFTDIKKLIVFLSINSELYDQNRQLVIDLIKDKNKKWIGKYIHL